ncbi:MAG: glycosyltransferase family 2 protein [Nitrospirota bacterium]|nr:glycosyltransferase family 2 protein [Nitrospirota bacterium]
MERSEIGIVIPAFNEEHTISGVIRKCKEFGTPIVVDDGSTDRTSEISNEEHAHVVRHDKNLGYDSALNSGFAAAEKIHCKYVITIDADGQHDPRVLNTVISLLDSGADIVIGIRNKRQRLAEHVFSLITRILYGIHDPLCGLKGYKMDVYNKLGYFDSYNSVGTELMLFSARNGCLIEQIPFGVRARKDHPRFGSKIYANLKIFRSILLSLYLPIKK